MWHRLPVFFKISQQIISESKIQVQLYDNSKYLFVTVPLEVDLKISLSNSHDHMTVSLGEALPVFQTGGKMDEL